MGPACCGHCVALPELAIVHGCICSSAFVLPLGLTSQTFHLCGSHLSDPALNIAPARGPGWMEPLRALMSPYNLIHHALSSCPPTGFLGVTFLWLAVEAWGPLRIATPA